MEKTKKTKAKLAKGEIKIGSGVPADRQNQDIPERIINKYKKKR